MRKSKLTAFVLLLLLPLALETAKADPIAKNAARAENGPLDCLSFAKGKVLLWDARWGETASDNGTQYRVLEVSTRYTYPVKSQSVALVLSSADPADHPYRKMVISDEKTAANVCSRLRERPKTVTLPSAIRPPATAVTAEAAPDNTLPFITYSPDGWVRADTPTDANLTICQVLLRPFLCTKDDRNTFADRLRDLEQTLLSGTE